MKVLPADRLQSVAERVLAAQPNPPRAVGTFDVMGAFSVFGALLVPDLLIVLALLVLGGSRLRPFVLTIAAGMTLLGLAVGAFLISSARAALERGTVAEGEVLTVQPRAWPSFGQHGRLHVDRGGRPFEAEYAWAGSAAIGAGDRMRVLIDQDAHRVLLSLGPTS